MMKLDETTDAEAKADEAKADGATDTGTTADGMSIDEVTAYLSHSTSLQDALGIPEDTKVSASILARGEYNENYIFEHPVTQEKLTARINLGSQMHLANQIEYEAQALRLLEESGRTPQLRYVDNEGIKGQGVLIETWLPGRPLNYVTDLEKAACILADVHSVPVPANHGLVAPENPLQNIVAECAAMFDVYRRWSKADTALVPRIDRWLAYGNKHAQEAALQGARHLISTELNSQNFLINDERGATSYLVDWEKPLVAEVEQDLAHFLVPTTTYWKTDSILSRSERTAFVQTYCTAVAGRFDTPGIEQRLEEYLAITCMRGITWSAMALAQHKTGERLVADAYTLKKIDTFLQREFLDMLECEFFE